MAPLDLTTTAGLLAYVKFMARRPASDAEVTDDEWYTLLATGQEEMYLLISLHAPGVLVEAPTKLETTDNKVFTFPGGIWPFGGVEVRASLGGRLLSIGPEFDEGVDLVPEGDSLRVVNDALRTFSDGPYARYVKMPSSINSSTEPSLQPPFARPLIGLKALIDYAHRGGGQRNPSFYEALFQKKWSGNPAIAGDGGLMSTLATQYFGYGRDPLHGTIPWSELRGYDEV